MTRKYVVTIDSAKYEVEVEENGAVKSSKACITVQAAPVQAAVGASAPPAPKVEESAPAPAFISADGNKVTAPLPGTLVKLIAKQGAAVKEGDALCVIEAMKMENEIPSPFSGTVVSIAVNEGKNVNAGDLLFVIA